MDKQNTEARLTAENSSLGTERSQLSDLMRNLQTMQHEIERASGETRSRLEEQVTRLESQLYVVCLCFESRSVEVKTGMTRAGD